MLDLDRTNCALVHEWLTPEATGGSELVVRQILSQIDADLFALIDFESRNPDSYLYGRTIGSTFLQRFPKARSGVQKYLPLLPLAIEQLDLGRYDVVLSSSHAVAKGVITYPHQFHICYCHTPMRYAWDLTFEYLQASRLGRGIAGGFTRAILHYLRQWDVISANRVDRFIANSQHTARRIWRCYRRKAEVIYPPVNVDRFPLVTQKEDFYVTVCRLVSYKRVELIVRAFNEIGKPIFIIGGGPQLEELRAIAKPNVQLLGSQPDAVVNDYVSHANAFVYAACEDFGIAPVEAQACGTPVIAYRRGGTGETVIDVRDRPEAATGVLFDQQTVPDLIAAVESFDRQRNSFDPDNARTQSERFTPKIFDKQYLTFVRHCLESQERHRDFT
jgi:glycosyltransferase involved in cell wall biosynthesis